MSNTVKLNNCPRCGAPIPADAPQGLCPKCVLLGAATSTEHGVPATATSEIPTLARIAAAFPQLEIIELIGRGGMGFVFKARQPHLDRFVALKLLPDKLARDPRFAERFGREGRVLAKLNHPNIVSVYDFGSTEHFYFLLMEYVDGVNLKQAMQAGRFSPGEALAIVPKICEALQYAHGQGVLHRDIKPENILLDARGRVKIADFGIAKLVGEEKPDVTLTATGAALGTPHYMAPEQLEKPSEVDHRADIYSLGVVFYEMLTGELPIGRFAAPSSKTPVGANVDEVVFRTLEKDRERRFQSAREMQTQVEHLTDAGAGAETGSAPAAPIDNSAVARPAKALLAAGIFNWVASIAVVCLLAFTSLGQTWPLAPAELGTVCLLIIALSSLIIVGALKMLRMESYALAVAGSVAAMITSPGSIIGLPAGIWSLMTLRRSDVRAAFARQRSVSLASKRPAADAGLVPRWSRMAVWAAVLTGLSLPTPLPFLLLAYLGAGAGGLGRGELGIGLGAVSLPGLAGFILGWMALSDIRAHQGRLRGSPLAIFAALTWPLLLLVGGTLVAPLFIAYQTAPGADTRLRTIPMLLVVAGTITFAVWAVHATVRWAGNQPATRQRGVLKWVFLGLLLAGLGVILLPRLIRSGAAHVSTGAPSAAVTNSSALEASPMIQFTFTAVELREEEGVRWLTMDFTQQDRGECERTLRYNTSVPGFTMQTRTTSFMTDGKAGFAPVLHQRIAWKLPDSLPPAEAEALRDIVGKERIGRPIVLAPGEEYPLFKTVVPGGGSLVASIGAKLRKAKADSAEPSVVGSARLIAAGQYRNVAMARLESLPGHPLHELIARFAGPRIPEISPGIQPPLLFPSPDEDMNTPVEPVDAWGTNSAPIASAFSFECPGDYSLQFVLPDEDAARDAARQIREVLAQPMALIPGRQTQLFATGSWKGWIEVRPFQASPNKLAFFRHPGRSPAQIPGTNSVESVVATIPPGHQLQLTGRAVVNGMNQSEPIFSATLASGPKAPGVYWFTWYLLPNPPVHDVNPKEDWELQIHDAAGRELHRVKAPRELKTLWKRRPIGDPINVRAGTPVKQQLFEKPYVAGARSVTFVFLELEMERAALVDQSPAAASAELWAPRLAPGENPQPYEILQEASRLAGQGSYEEALQRHLWYHHHALEFQPSQAGVRLSFALSQWLELARRYPKAKDALVELRDRCVDEFSRSGSRSFFTEISFINKALKEDYATVALFKSVQERDPKLSRQCYQLVEDLLVETGEYALCASFVPDVQQRFNQIRAKRDKMQDAARDPRAGSALLREEAQRVFIKETRALVEILVGVGRKGEAEEIRDLALTIVDELELQVAVSDAEARVKSMRARLEPK